MTILAETTRRRLSTDVETTTYLTDGLRLFRVVRGFSFPVIDSWATLEDCRTLGQHTFSPDELWGMGLCVVHRAGAVG